MAPVNTYITSSIIFLRYLPLDIISFAIIGLCLLRTLPSESLLHHPIFL